MKFLLLDGLIKLPLILSRYEVFMEVQFSCYNSYLFIQVFYFFKSILVICFLGNCSRRLFKFIGVHLSCFLISTLSIFIYFFIPNTVLFFFDQLLQHFANFISLFKKGVFGFIDPFYCFFVFYSINSCIYFYFASSDFFELVSCYFSNWFSLIFESFNTCI